MLITGVNVNSGITKFEVLKSMQNHLPLPLAIEFILVIQVVL